MRNKSLFLSARIKLTAFYLLIIMTISIIFSLVIFSGVNNELSHIEAHQQARQDRLKNWSRDNDLPPPPEPNIREIEDARFRLILTLILIDLGILGVSGIGGYFLAGLTLDPIQEMMEGQSRFISDASHELRTPLTVLRSEIEVALRDKRLTPKDTQTVLESNLEEVIALQSLSDSLLELTSTNGIAHTPVSLDHVIEQALKSVKVMATEKKITLKSKTIDLIVRGNESQLIRLIVILLDNAIKYNPPKTTVTIATKRVDHTALITVTDTGVGIQAEDLPYIFNRFYRADKSRNKEVSGYGLGLSIAQKLIKQHDGSISVVSKEGKGTTFSMRLPIPK